MCADNEITLKDVLLCGISTAEDTHGIDPWDKFELTVNNELIGLLLPPNFKDKLDSENTINFVHNTQMHMDNLSKNIPPPPLPHCHCGDSECFPQQDVCGHSH